MKNQHEEMEGLLRRELDKEAQAILDEIASDESLKDLTFPEENEEALMQKIQALEEKQASYENMSEKDKEALRLGREMQAQQENGKDGGEAEDAPESVVPFKKRKRKKVYLMIAVVAVLAFAMSMTSIGEVPLVTEMKNQILGTSKMVKMNSEREGEESVKEGQHTEAEAYGEIEKELDVNMVRLEYLPEDIRFLDFEIDTTLKKAFLLYQCQNSILEYRLSISPMEQASGYQVEDELIDEETFIVKGVPIDLKCYEISDSTDDLYVAQFEYQSMYYTLTGTLPDEEMQEILKNLNFF